jgi:hypothetical protein
MKSDAEIDIYMRDIDRTLLRENLKLTPAQRLEKFVNFIRFASKLRRAGEKVERPAIAVEGPKR